MGKILRRLSGALAIMAFTHWMTVGAFAQVIDRPNGFTGQTGLTFTNNASVTASGNAQITPAVNNNRGSFWSTVQVPISEFTTRFTFHELGAVGSAADGIGFCIQRVGNTAIGSGGGGMGYTGIVTSIFVKFDNYNNESSTGLYQNGADPTGGSINMRPNIDIHSQHNFRVDMTYNGTVLAMTVTDLTTNATFTQNFTVNIPAVIGGTTAHVGFTGATGGLNANQEILNWTFGQLPPPAGLTATAGVNQVTLNWTASAGASTYNVFRSTTAGGPYTQIATGVAAVTYQDNTAAWPNTYFYAVQGIAGANASVKSNEASAAPLPPAIQATPNTGLQTNENGATAVFNIRLNQALTAGNSISFTVQSQDASEGGVSGFGQPAGAPFATTINFTVNGPQASGYQIPITVTGIDDAMVDPATAYQVAVSATSTQASFNGVTIPNVQLTNNDNDVAGITVSRTSGLVTTEGGGQDSFSVALNTVPSAPVTMTLTSSNTQEGTVSSASLTFNSTTPQVVTLTGADDAALDFAVAYTIVTGNLSSTDANYDTLPVPDVSAINMDDETIPTLPTVWGGGSGGGCGLTGLEVALVLGLSALGRRRRLL